MRFFNTEMIFIHPPRSRFGYGRHAPRLSRYGRRPQTAHIETASAAPLLRVVVERAA